MKNLKRSEKSAEGTRVLAPGLIGRQLLEAGKLTEGDIKRIVALQRQDNSRFGEIAVGLGLLTEQDVREALSRQFEYPYKPLAHAQLGPQLVAAHQPFGAATEPFRTLRSELLLRWFSDRRQTIMVASSRSDEGASGLAANLAIVFAQMGERTLLIDANLRQPSQHLLFGLKGAVGLSSLLTGRSAFSESFNEVGGFQTLSVMCAGAIPPNPQELLSRVGFSYLIETAPANFDIVIVDAPPILESSDAQIVASRVGACVLATRRNQTRPSDLLHAKSILQPSGAQLVGAVICG